MSVRSSSDDHSPGAQPAEPFAGATHREVEQLDSPCLSVLNAVFREVLLVDDDPAILRIVSKVLETSGYHVRQARDGYEAMEALRESPPDFIITDWLMPKIDGLELCRMLRREPLQHYVYLIVLTGKNRTQDMVQAIAAGANDFTTKPVVSGELLARLMAGARVLELERRLTELARSDPLTGLLNRRTFFGLFEQHWVSSARTESPLSCVMIDLDFFKKVNDTHGHPAGDAVLKGIAVTLEKCCRRSDFLCRYGGEEFCVLLLDTCEQGAVQWAERCRRMIADSPLATSLHTVNTTASFGVAQRTASTETPESLLDLADSALLRAKRLGRNRVEVSTSGY